MTVYKSLEEAISICCDSIKGVESQYLHVDTAYRRVAAKDIFSSSDVPHFDRSAMDGYVIGQVDLEKLLTDDMLTLQVTATIPAGSTEDRRIKTGETYRIMTGALLPDGSAAVIKQEDVQIHGNNMIAICRPLKPGENIQTIGHELRAGVKLASQGQVLTAEQLERITACGIEYISVYKIPRIYVIETGNELVLPGSPLKTGQIYGSNRSLISAKIAGLGANPLLADSIIGDDLPAIVNEINKGSLVSDMIIVCGGTGNGDYDLVYRAFENLKARTLFRGINIIPGQGTSSAVYKDILLYNLSGNPHAAGLLLDTLIKPALLKLKGDLFSAREWFDISLDSPIGKIKQHPSLIRGEMILKNGCAYARPIYKGNTNLGNIPLILSLQARQGNTGDTVKALLLY